jgi:hypothetical protein
LQSQQVWKFIINREIEAPSRFKAIQTYRAAMAIFKQQQQFVGHLYSSGMIDESEQEVILHPIQKKERLLQRRGPHWTTPSISEVPPATPSHPTCESHHSQIFLPWRSAQEAHGVDGCRCWLSSSVRLYH